MGWCLIVLKSEIEEMAINSSCISHLAARHDQKAVWLKYSWLNFVGKEVVTGSSNS